MVEVLLALVVVSASLLLLHVVAMSTCVQDVGRFVQVILKFIRFRICELHSFSRRWLKSYGDTMQHIYLSDALLFICAHLFCDCVRAHLFCVVWIACAFKSVRVALVSDCFSSLVSVIFTIL